MPNINIENISVLDINGHNLFEDSESFIDEITDDNEQSIIGGYYYCNRTYYKNNRPFRKTNNCGNTAACYNTISGYP